MRTNIPALSPRFLSFGIVDGRAKPRGSRIGIDRLVDVVDRGVDRSVGKGKDDLQFLTDLDLVGIELADASPHPEMVERGDRHQQIGGGVVIPGDDRALRPRHRRRATAGSSRAFWTPSSVLAFSISLSVKP